MLIIGLILAEIEAVITCKGPRPRSEASQSGDWTVRNSTWGNYIWNVNISQRNILFKTVILHLAAAISPGSLQWVAGLASSTLSYLSNVQLIVCLIPIHVVHMLWGLIHIRPLHYWTIAAMCRQNIKIILVRVTASVSTDTMDVKLIRAHFWKGYRRVSEAVKIDNFEMWNASHKTESHTQLNPSSPAKTHRDDLDFSRQSFQKIKANGSLVIKWQKYSLLNI